MDKIEDLKKIGDYDVINVLGEGGFGMVFLVEKNKVQYALKVYTRKGISYMNHEYNISNVITPITKTSTSSMCPPSIACSVDKGSFIFNNTEQYYLVMEYVDGYSLEEYFRLTYVVFKNISEKCLAKFAYHILKGIDFLHSHGVAHNDIKPDNIIFNQSQLKLIDLGFGCVLDNKKYVNPLSCSTSAFSGTVYYISPELYELYYHKIEYDKEIFIKNDIWCFGLTLAELCDYDSYSQKLGERVYDYKYENGYFPYIPETKKGKKIPLILRKMIKECLNFDYKKRPTAKKLLERLEKNYPYLKK